MKYPGTKQPPARPLPRSVAWLTEQYGPKNQDDEAQTAGKCSASTYRLTLVLTVVLFEGLSSEVSEECKTHYHPNQYQSGNDGASKKKRQTFSPTIRPALKIPSAELGLLIGIGQNISGSTERWKAE